MHCPHQAMRSHRTKWRTEGFAMGCGPVGSKSYIHLTDPFCHHIISVMVKPPPANFAFSQPVHRRATNCSRLPSEHHGGGMSGPPSAVPGFATKLCIFLSWQDDVVRQFFLCACRSSQCRPLDGRCVAHQYS